MKKLLARLVLVLCFLGSGEAFAQSTGTVVVDCTTGVGLAYTAGSTRPMTLLPTGAACVNASVTLAFPTIGAAVPATGIYNGINVGGTLRGLSGLSTGSIFPLAAAIVDGSGNQITSFGATGSTSNASSGVATSSINVPTVAYNYGFNGTTWDQLQVSPTKNLYIDAPTTNNNLYTAITSPPNLLVNGGNGIWTGVTPGTPQTGTIVAANMDATSKGGIAYGAMTNFGTTPGAVKVDGSNAFAFVTDQVGGAAAALVGDPCQTTAKTTLPITLATAAVKVIAVGVSAKKIYVCQLNLNNNAADSVPLFEATTGTTCVTSPVAVVGAGTSVATAAQGYNFGATSGIMLGNGASQVLQTATNANDLCIAQSAATQLTGSITYVTR